MEKLLLISMVLGLCVSFSYADELVLTSTEERYSPTKTLVWERYLITNRPDNKSVIVFMVEKDEMGNSIPQPGGSYIRKWKCFDGDDPATPEIENDTCFTDTFKFEIRPQDVGVKIGIGLRDLLKNEMEKDESVISSGNDGTFN